MARMTPTVAVNLGETTLRKLRRRAARHGRSMNAEVSHILRYTAEDQGRVHQLRGLRLKPAKIR
jgi:plasmid stability protein